KAKGERNKPLAPNPIAAKYNLSYLSFSRRANTSRRPRSSGGESDLPQYNPARAVPGPMQDQHKDAVAVTFHRRGVFMLRSALQSSRRVSGATRKPCLASEHAGYVE